MRKEILLCSGQTLEIFVRCSRDEKALLVAAGHFLYLVFLEMLAVCYEPDLTCPLNLLID